MRYFLFCMSLFLVHPAYATPPFNPLEEQQAPKEDIRPPDVIQWTAAEATANLDGSVTVGLRLSTKMEFTLYVDQVFFTNPAGYTLADIIAPPASTLMDPLTEKEVQVYSGGDFILTFKGLEPFRGAEFVVHIKYLGCTSRICLFPYTEVVNIPAYLASDIPSPTAAHAADDRKPIDPSPSQGKTLEERLASALHNDQEQLPLLLLVLLIFAGGLLTNLTPCVYPMIPITIRILAGRGQKAALTPSLAYSLGIMLTYTALGVLAALSGSLFGKFMALSSVNLFFAAIMALFAVSMLGYGNFNALQNLGNKIGNQGKGAANAFFMGTGAGLVAAPCTGPILAALLTYTSKQNNLLLSVLLLSTYSFGFALPYVFLGTAAARISRTQVPPAVQIGTKTAFAAIMFALSCYYLQVPFYETYKEITFSTWLITGLICIAVAALTLFLVAGSKSTSHAQTGNSLLILLALFLGTGCFALGQGYRLSSVPRISWLKSEHEAFAKAEREGAAVLIDMWANWCEACKKMDATTFSDPAVIKMLEDKKWVLLKLDLTKEDLETEDIQHRYDIAGLPTLIFIRSVKNGLSVEAPEKIAGYVSSAALLEFARKER